MTEVFINTSEDEFENQLFLFFKMFFQLSENEFSILLHLLELFYVNPSRYIFLNPDIKDLICERSEIKHNFLDDAIRKFCKKSILEKEENNFFRIYRGKLIWNKFRRELEMKIGTTHSVKIKISNDE
jgi:hypothetical protein